MPRAARPRLPPSSLPACARPWRCQCSRITSWSARSRSAAGRSVLSPTSRSRSSRISLPKPSSPLKMPGCSVADLQRERENKLMNLEAMAASIGHEVRQPLAGISSNGGAALRFLGHTPPNIEEARLALQRMVKDSHRASQVFDNIRTLFGKADQGHEPIDVNELALGVLQALREELKDHRITTQAELTSELPFVMGHRGQLQEVFINLVHNAIEAMAAIDDDQRILRVRAGRHGGNAITVAVEDSGPGIDPQQLKTIFDAFITTKPNGLGLGLAICRLIVERHKGQLTVAPAEPRGSAFRIVLPAGMPGVA